LLDDNTQNHKNKSKRCLLKLVLFHDDKAKGEVCWSLFTMVLTLVFKVYKVEQEMCRPFDISSCKKKARITTSFMFCIDFVNLLVFFFSYANH